MVVASCWLMSDVNIVFAQTPTEYNLLAPIPLSTPNTPDASTNAKEYIPGLFRLIIAIAGALAVVKIIFGGIQYMSTDAFSGKEEAKGTIQNAIWGLLLAMGAWMILYTINPKLTTFNLNITPQPITPVTGTAPGGGGRILPGYALTPEQIAQDQTIRQQLSQNNPRVRVNNSACTAGGTSGCTNVVLLPQNAISGVMNLASSCQSAMGAECSVIITGGAEGGHATHGPGIAVVDLGRNTSLDSHIRGVGQAVNVNTCSQIGPQYRLNGAIYVNEGDHWHVCY